MGTPRIQYPTLKFQLHPRNDLAVGTILHHLNLSRKNLNPILLPPSRGNENLSKDNILQYCIHKYLGSFVCFDWYFRTSPSFSTPHFPCHLNVWGSKANKTKQCHPISDYWNPFGTRCYPAEIPLFIHGLTNTITDVWIYVLPMKMVWEVQLPKRQRIGLVTIFGAGFLYFSPTP